MMAGFPLDPAPISRIIKEENGFEPIHIDKGIAYGRKDSLSYWVNAMYCHCTYLLGQGSAAIRIRATTGKTG